MLRLFDGDKEVIYDINKYNERIKIYGSKYKRKISRTFF